MAASYALTAGRGCTVSDPLVGLRPQQAPRGCNCQEVPICPRQRRDRAERRRQLHHSGHRTGVVRRSRCLWWLSGLELLRRGGRPGALNQRREPVRTTRERWVRTPIVPVKGFKIHKLQRLQSVRKPGQPWEVFLGDSLLSENMGSSTAGFCAWYLYLRLHNKHQ